MGYKDITFAVNISGKQLQGFEDVERIISIVESVGCPKELIKLELTESMMMHPTTELLESLKKLKEEGFKLALDDFGTGYSSFNYLKTMPIDVIKLDATFMSGILNSTQDRIIFDAINQLTHDLGMSLIAEGIETEDENILIRQEGCDFGQGYLYGKPSDPEQILKLLESQKTMLQ